MVESSPLSVPTQRSREERDAMSRAVASLLGLAWPPEKWIRPLLMHCGMRIQPKRCRQLSCLEHMSDVSVRRICVSCQRNETCAHSSCPFILANMAEEEVAKVVVGHDSGMCKTSFAGDDKD